jgi:hypothetical protein
VPDHLVVASTRGSGEPWTRRLSVSQRTASDPAVKHRGRRRGGVAASSARRRCAGRCHRGAGVRPARRGKLPAVATLASYALAVIGFIMMAAAVAKTFGAGLQYIYTRPLIINALRTNGNHAELLCKSNPDGYFGAIGAAIKAGGMTGSRDPGVIASTTAPTYDAQGQAILMRWTALIGKVKLALMAAGGAVVVGASKGFPPVIVIILAALVGIGFLRLFLFKAEVERCIVRARAEILPEVDRSFADGRYVFPPQPKY